jgi:hypothetical protein
MKTQKTIYIITGAPNDRKSSTIRALTGVHNGKSFDVDIDGTIEKVFVITTSPNEITSDAFPVGISPTQLVELIKGLKNESKVVLPLRTSNTKHNLPCADQYINVLQVAGFEIANVAMFNNNINLPAGVTGTLITNTRTSAANQLASTLRKLWGFI